MPNPTWQDQLHVEYLEHMGSDESIANAARVSFAAHDTWNQLPDGYSAARCAGLIRYLAQHQHMAPFRHPHITFRCAAPIHVTRQLMKHQTGMTWSEESRRYIKKPIELFAQEYRAAPDQSIKQGSGKVITEMLVPWVQNGVDQVPPSQTCAALATWYDQAIENGIAPETLRGFLPQNMLTHWVWTGSLLSWAHLYNLRSTEHAQKEVRLFASKIHQELLQRFPVAWEALTTDWAQVALDQKDQELARLTEQLTKAEQLLNKYQR